MHFHNPIMLIILYSCPRCNAFELMHKLINVVETLKRKYTHRSCAIINHGVLAMHKSLLAWMFKPYLKKILSVLILGSWDSFQIVQVVLICV